MTAKIEKSGRQARFFFTRFFTPRWLIAFGFLALTGLALLIYALIIEPRSQAIRRVDITIPGWSGAPMTVALVSDIHMGGLHVGVDRVEALIADINALKPDMIVIAGDFINSHEPRLERSEKARAELTEGLALFAKLSAPNGVYFVLGNHDYQYDSREVKSALEFGGLVDVTDQATIVNNQICLFGLDDEWFGDPKVDAYDDCPVGLVSVALMHNPDAFTRLDPAVDLRLSGHTHGGQVNLPIAGRVVTATKAGKKWAYGLIENPRAFVTAGFGTSGLPIRFRAKPEIALLTLRP